MATNPFRRAWHGPLRIWPAPLPWAPTREQALALLDEIEVSMASHAPSITATPRLHAIVYGMTNEAGGYRYGDALVYVQKATLLWLAHDSATQGTR